VAEKKGSRASFENARSKANEVLRHAVADSAFREQLKKDPTNVLKKYGLDEAAAEDFGREMVIDGNRLSALMPGDCSWTCSWTCWWTSW
jgi:hypothetical protein